MDLKLINTIRTNYENKATSELLAIWESNNQGEYSVEAFEAVKQILIARNQALPSQKSLTKDESIENECIKDLPETSGWPCMLCCNKDRSLKYRRLGYTIGFFYWRRTKIWEGYICNKCSWKVTATSLVYGFASLFLTHPQALFWTPVIVAQNISRTFKGASPPQYLAFQQGDLQNGRITPTGAAHLAATAQEILNEDKFNVTGLVIGSVAILCGFKDANFSRRIYAALLAPSGKKWFQYESLSDKKLRPDKKWLKKWASKIEEVR